MTTLTAQLLNAFPYSRYASARSIQRGQEYYEQGRVWDLELIGMQKAICSVEGDTDEYTVEIEVNQNGELTFDCDCPYAAEGNFCKHIIAAALELKDYLEAEAKDEFEEEAADSAPQTRPGQDWRTKLNETLASLPRKSASGNRPIRYAAAVVLARSRYGYTYGGYQYGYSLMPLIVRENDWSPLQQLEGFDREGVNRLLETDIRWIAASNIYTQPLNPKGCLNLDAEGVAFLEIIRSVSQMYGNVSAHLANYFAMIARADIPIFLTQWGYPPKMERRLRILPRPIELQMDLQADESKLTLWAGFEQNGTFTHIRQNIEVVTKAPVWALLDDTLAQIENSHAIEAVTSFPIEIPREQIERFREEYFPHIAQDLPVKSGLVQWMDFHADPVPRLYLRDDNKEKTLRAELRFGYGEYELPPGKDETFAIQAVPDSWDLLRIHRNLEREQSFYQLLADPIYRLKRAGAGFPHGTFELRARTHPFDFLLHSIPLLTQAGFEIYGEENLTLGKVNRATPTLRVSITSGIDWFDLKTIVEFGDQQVSFHDVRKALKRGERYIKLADGSVGQIPEEWLEKYQHLWNLAQETEDGFRVSDVHLPLLDSLLEDNPSIQTPAELAARRERLRAFERIEPQPLPSGFVGELRPYQKHGFDWLHFLHDYQFGGVLADDMGLGKTVQVLAFLQSLKEQPQADSEPRAASLLVVPKSLIANWQREAEKFTPGLRFLEYMGNFRAKNTAVFDDYDVVLTTYGTMLRDVELLRTYKFHYVILDESQAIKNPLAKSAKATRLLNAEHRLVMTGTPVENNTFELWSQFAFLNPGLLGSMDYFKSAFATPIEARGDEQAAKTLRKLVYPFILRRTKEQVAPELPPRTERILYTDMDTAQKKLYAQTRERYRAELLGLIEREGLNDARFKILEGLLRLRQIAVHPALVEKNYRGSAPKFELLLETLETLQVEGHKALVFSQFVETLALLKRELDARNIKYAYLDGSTRNRQERVDKFQNDPSIPFFLISLKAGGVGLNLTAAEYVIHLDPWWNPAVEMQASDRAHRIGQDKPVFIYKVITRGTVEEKILQLQEKKRALVQSLIVTEASFFKSLTQDDVKDLFS